VYRVALRYALAQDVQTTYTLGLYEYLVNLHPEELEYVPAILVAVAFHVVVEDGHEPVSWYSLLEYEPK
jgi:hypothetical protein